MTWEQPDRKTGIGLGVGERASFHTLPPLPASPQVHQPRSSLNSLLLGVYGDSITWSHLVFLTIGGHWPLVTNTTSSPSPFPGIQRVGLKVQTSIPDWFSWLTSPRLQVLSKSHFININSIAVEGGFIFHLYCLEEMPELRQETKYYGPYCSYHSGNAMGLGALSQSRQKPNTWNIFWSSEWLYIYFL